MIEKLKEILPDFKITSRIPKNPIGQDYRYPEYLTFEKDKSVIKISVNYSNTSESSIIEAIYAEVKSKYKL